MGGGKPFNREKDKMNNEHIIFVKEAELPYSDIVVTEGKYMFISGLVSEDLNTREEIYGTMQFETKTLLDNLKTILEANGSDMDHVVKADVIVRNWADRAEMNEEYVKHFRADKLPARILFGDVSLSGESKVEMSFVATKK